MKASAPRSRSAHAKVNLTLAVLGRGEDRYHALESVFLRIGLADVLDVRVRSTHPTYEIDADDLYVDGEKIRGELQDNLVLRAARAIREEAGSAFPPLHFTLHKQIPVEAGLGGGSSDAAATISAAEAAWGGRFRPEPRRRIVERLGSDVPFFASGSEAALVRGRGETVERLPPPSGTLGILLVTPLERLKTADVFNAYDSNERYRGGGSPAQRLTAELTIELARGMPTTELLRMAIDLRDANDLWPAAARVAALTPLRVLLERRLARPVLLSGSGPTLFALFESAGEATTAARSLSASGHPDLRGGTIIVSDTVNAIPLWRGRP